MTIKNKEGPSAWEGNWQERIHERLNALGYRTFCDYLRGRPGWSYRELAKELSTGEETTPVATVQLERMRAWSVAADERQDAILDSFARHLRGALKKGWGVGHYWDTDVIGTLTGWFVSWGEGADLDAFRREVFRMNPKAGWIPKGADDPILQEAAQRVWSTK